MASHHEVPLSLVDGDLETIIVGVDIGLTCTGTFAGLLTTASRAAQYDSKHAKRESYVFIFLLLLLVTLLSSGFATLSSLNTSLPCRSCILLRA
jgi:hypothetical protein